MKRFIYLLLILIPTIISGIAICEEDMPYEPHEQKTFSHTYKLPGNIRAEFKIATAYKNLENVNKVFNLAEKEVTRIAQSYEKSNKQSILSKLENNAGKNPISINQEEFIILSHSKEMADWTRGAFDFVKGNGNYKNLKINKKKMTAYLNEEGLSIDLSDIINGFIADIFIEVAKSNNFENAFVKVNGISMAIGNDSYSSWQLVLSGTGKKKVKRGMTIILSNYAAATVGGIYPAPKIDPRNKQPIDTPFYSNTVITKRAATAQGMAIALYVMGPKEGSTVIDQMGIRAVAFNRDGTQTPIGRW